MKKFNEKFNQISRALLGGSIIYVLIYEIDIVRSVVRNILKYAEVNRMLFGLSSDIINQLYLYLRKFAIYYIVLYICCFFIIKIGFLTFDKYIKSKNSNLNAFEESLFKYLNYAKSEKCYLVSGDWGTGKTFSVSNFFEKHYKFSSKKIYRISCFGLESRQQVLNEIKEQVEFDDDSVLNLVQYIPIIGKPVYGLLKKSYSLQSIPKGSIFIFDDFERITSRGININQESNYYTKDPFLNHQTKHDEFKNVNKEFEKIEKSFKNIKNIEQNQIVDNHTQKYNVVTGLINEIIETYKMKVIIICNVDILGYDYVDKVFRGKLDCITYNKSIDLTTLKDIVNSTVNNQIYSDKELKRKVELFLGLIICDFDRVWIACGKNNLRQAKSIVQAFLETIELIKNTGEIEEEMLISLFYNIFVVRILYDEGNLEYLNEFRIGGNLLFYLRLYTKNRTLINALSVSEYIDKIRWMGVSVAGFWILNISKPSNVQNIMKQYHKYDYIKVEYELLNQPEFEIRSRALLFEHVLYILEGQKPRLSLQAIDNNIEELHVYVENNFNSLFDVEDSLSNESKVLYILEKIDALSGGRNFNRISDILFKPLYLTYNVNSVSQDSFTHARYNEFVKEYERKSNNT